MCRVIFGSCFNSRYIDQVKRNGSVLLQVLQLDTYCFAYSWVVVVVVLLCRTVVDVVELCRVIFFSVPVFILRLVISLIDFPLYCLFVRACVAMDVFDKFDQLRPNHQVNERANDPVNVDEFGFLVRHLRTVGVLVQTVP